MDFTFWSAAFPGLLWAIEPRRSRITLYNDWVLPALGQDTPRLLKDSSFRQSAVRESDLPLVQEFWTMVRNQQNAMVSFRLRNSPNTGCLLQGWPHAAAPEIYFGMLKESLLPAALMLKGLSAHCQLALGQTYPVLLINVGNAEILTCNKAAQDLLGPINANMPLRLGNIAPDNLGRDLLNHCRDALREDSWTGPILLRDSSGNLLGGSACITKCGGAREITRVALLASAEKSAKIAFDTNAMAQIATLGLRDGLAHLLSHCPGVDGLMFSDIQPTPGQVHVYGVGKLFASLAWGAPHAYEGTIAQDIDRYGLNSVAVENTLDSIKSIDWALFIPCGARSYFAKPFFAENGLHAVLILAFAEPAKVPFNEEDFQPLYEPFAGIIDKWRKDRK